ncbi:hypothetical protein [Hydromonas duriensis]|uniref:hypothetical protein n=1 Tax=Hydromonas duriensis TaxID=1527608 RepID=UPI001060C96B|nr:hypothetical protein [Hydromonas duriensis]
MTAHHAKVAVIVEWVVKIICGIEKKHKKGIKKLSGVSSRQFAPLYMTSALNTKCAHAAFSLLKPPKWTLHAFTANSKTTIVSFFYMDNDSPCTFG